MNLIGKGADINQSASSDSWGTSEKFGSGGNYGAAEPITPIMAAVLMDDQELVRVLVTRGADLLATTPITGLTAFHMCAITNNDTAGLLILRKSDYKVLASVTAGNETCFGLARKNMCHNFMELLEKEYAAPCPVLIPNVPLGSIRPITLHDVPN